MFGCEHHAGEITLAGDRCSLPSPRAALTAGIGMIAADRTEESVALSLSIRENTFMNRGLRSQTALVHVAGARGTGRH